MNDKRKVIHVLCYTPGIKGRWGVPALWEGKPGGGKTSQIECYGSEDGFWVEPVIASIREPSELALGMPHRGKTTPAQLMGTRWVSFREKRGDDLRDFDEAINVMEYAAPRWALRCGIAGHAIAFFDEINTAPPASQAATLRVFTDGWVGDYHMPRTVRFMGAQNATDDAAGGWDLSPPLANRFVHLPWDIDQAAFAEFMMGIASFGELHTDGSNATVDPAAEERRVLDAIRKPLALSSGLVAGFTKAKAELLLKMPEAHSPDASKAWPSPRTWEYLARLRAGAQVHGLDAGDAEILQAGCVGQGAFVEFMRYAHAADLPDPEDVVDRKVPFKHNPARLDRTAAILSSITAFVAPQNCDQRKERAGVVWNILEEVAGDAADLCLSPGRVLVQAKLSGLPQAGPVLQKLTPLRKIVEGLKKAA